MTGLSEQAALCNSPRCIHVVAAISWLLVFLGSGSMSGEVRLPAVLANHMVIQRDEPVHLWGRADAGEQVHVNFRGHNASATTGPLGRWSVYLPSGDAGGPFSLSIEGKNRIELTDVLVGDLWLASGQSNMEFPMMVNPPWTNGVRDAKTEIAAANEPAIRLFQVKQNTSNYPLDDLVAKQSWTACTPQSVAGFSAVAYFFGRDLLAAEKVPIGLIESSVGGTPAESWTSMDALTSNPLLMPVFAARARMMDSLTTIQLQQAVEERGREQAKSHGTIPVASPWRPDPATWAPSALFNAMIAPLTPFPLRGVIWYQGESNTDVERAPIYAHLFPAMIEDWRAHWAQGNFPFLFVQIANYNSTDDWPTVRDAQRQTLALANTGMAVTVDIGEPANIHPKNKQEVGRRLALWARAISYGERVEDSGPLFRQAVPEGSGMQVLFDHRGRGLIAKNGALHGFELAGPDRKFVPATAIISGEGVQVTSDSIPHPVYVRYGWATAPEVNLYNREDLPASPFTTAP